jgi:hypothetical protein
MLNLQLKTTVFEIAAMILLLASGKSDNNVGFMNFDARECRNSKKLVPLAQPAAVDSQRKNVYTEV